MKRRWNPHGLEATTNHENEFGTEELIYVADFLILMAGGEKSVIFWRYIPEDETDLSSQGTTNCRSLWEARIPKSLR